MENNLLLHSTSGMFFDFLGAVSWWDAFSVQWAVLEEESIGSEETRTGSFVGTFTSSLSTFHFSTSRRWCTWDTTLGRSSCFDLVWRSAANSDVDGDSANVVDEKKIANSRPTSNPKKMIRWLECRREMVGTETAVMIALLIGSTRL